MSILSIEFMKENNKNNEGSHEMSEFIKYNKISEIIKESDVSL